MPYDLKRNKGTRWIPAAIVILAASFFLSVAARAEERAVGTRGGMRATEVMLQLYEQDIEYLKEELKELVQECGEVQT